MNYFSNLTGKFVLAGILCTLPLAAWGQGLGERAGLQAAMQQYVDQQTVDGVYLYIDEKDGKVRTLHPVTAHPKIMSMDQYNVLCFDFRNDEGKKVNVDFYMARKENSYVVFHTAVDDHTLIDLLKEEGRLTGPG